jgi:ankyrin repeat protein
MHGEMYEIKMAEFLFARALNHAKEFRVASSLDGIGKFDDFVFRYRLKERDVWKTCFIQLKHKKNAGKIQRCSITQLSGDFSLFKYFVSYCQIKSKASTDRNLKQCGPFDEFEFIIYTNARMEYNSDLEEEDTEPLSILSSGSNNRQYVTFHETCDTGVFEFFQELIKYKDCILELENLIKRENLMDEKIKEKIKDVRNNFTSPGILDSLDALQSRSSDIKKMVKEFKECDFSLGEEFLSKVKIFQHQSNEKSFDILIKQELQKACQASPSCANSIYRKFVDNLKMWWGKSGSVKWLSENSHAWQSVKQYLTEKIKELSESEFQENESRGLRFKQQHIERLSDAIKQNTFLNIVTSTHASILSKLKTYQSLVSLGYRNSLFINLKTLVSRRKEVLKLWPCKWSAVLVITCEKVSEYVDDNTIDTLVALLHPYQQKMILISSGKNENLASRLREKLGNACEDYEDKCTFHDLDEESQQQLLESTVEFQEIDIVLKTLVGENPSDIVKQNIDSDVISILLSRGKKLRVGRKLGDHSKYSVPRMLERHIYLKDDILKLTDNAITFAVSGLHADQLKNYVLAGEKICEFLYDDREGSHSFKILDYFSKTGLSADWKSINTHHNIGQKIKPEDVRYIILGKQQPKRDFRKLKKMFTNIHWIHMENGSFLWRESSCNIGIIRRYIDDTKYKKYDVKRLMEHNDRTMLLVAEPGMGKSTFFSNLEHDIKKWNNSVWVLRINLHEHTRELENIDFEEECIAKCKKFLWNAAHLPEQVALTLVENIFLQAMEQRGKMVILLDGFDEISPDYSPKVEMLLRAIREKTASKIWVSSRLSYRQDLEDIMIKLAFTLQPFTAENQITLLEQYWKEVMKVPRQGNPRMFAKMLLNLTSKNFRDKDGEFTGIPLQTMMLGEAFVKEAKEYCSSGEVKLPEKFDLLALFKKFTGKKCDIYFSEKNEMDTSKPEVKLGKKSLLQKHKISALMSLFSLNEVNRLLGTNGAGGLEQAKEFLCSGRAEHFGIITDITDSKPHFIHRCFAEYFAAKWFTDNFAKCELFISDTLFNPTYEVTRNIFDRMLAEKFEIHGAVLNNDIAAVDKFLTEKRDLNAVDKGGRTALHLAASYNSPITQILLSAPNVDANKQDRVLKWTPLRYAYKTMSWMAMDILLQNGGNTEDIVLTASKREDQEWVQAALWECAQKGYKKLLDFMLSCGTDVNAVVRVPENIHMKCSLLHIASLFGQLEVVRLLVQRNADINFHDANNNNALHFAAHSGCVDIIKLLLDKGMSVNLTNAYDTTPLHISAACGNLKATKTFVKRGADLNKTDKNGHTPLMQAAYYGKLDIIRYLTETDANLNAGSEACTAALLSAVGGGHTDVAQLLLANGADINGSNAADDMSPLIIATLTQNLPAVKYLVQRGADVNFCTRGGRRGLALCAAAFVGNLEITDFLLSAGADLNVRDFYCMNPLAIAVSRNKTKLALYLMEKGADVNVPDVLKITPLLHAVAKNNLKLAKRLVQLGANVNYQGPENLTALSVATELERIHIISFLVENHANANLRDVLGNTALHVAVAKGNLSLVHYLIDRGADVNIPNNKGNTPLQWIISRNWQVIADHLLYARIPKCFPPLDTELVGSCD